MPFCTKNPLVRIIVGGEVSNRNYGQGHHWTKSNHAKKKMFAMCKQAKYFRWSPRQEDFLTASIKECSIPSRQAVNIIATRILGKGQRLWDADSILRGDFKQLMDSIVQLGILEDDGPKFVKNVLGQQDSQNRNWGPAFEIMIYEA